MSIEVSGEPMIFDTIPKPRSTMQPMRDQEFTRPMGRQIKGGPG